MSGPAYDRLLTDYVGYHAALVVVGAVFTACLLAVTIGTFLGWRRSGRRTYLALSITSLVVTAVFALIVAANLSTVLNPDPGLSNVITVVEAGERGQLLNTWLASGTASVPAQLQALIDQRLAWQSPKAIICALGLIAAGALTLLAWRRRLGGGPPGWLLLGIGGYLACVVLMVMVMANVQAVFAPIGMTLMFG